MEEEKDIQIVKNINMRRFCKAKKGETYYPEGFYDPKNNIRYPYPDSKPLFDLSCKQIIENNYSNEQIDRFVHSWHTNNPESFNGMLASFFDKNKDLSCEVFQGYVSTAVCIWNMGETEYIEQSYKLVNLVPTPIMRKAAVQREKKRQRQRKYQRSDSEKKKRKLKKHTYP
eukprot:405422_1